MQKNYKENHLKPYAVKSLNSRGDYIKKLKILLDPHIKGTEIE